MTLKQLKVTYSNLEILKVLRTQDNFKNNKHVKELESYMYFLKSKIYMGYY